MVKSRHSLFRAVARSGFVRSVFLRVLSIFLIASIVIAAVAFSSFRSEIRQNVLSDRQKQLTAVEETISQRMAEIASIAYSIGADPDFYLEPAPDAVNDGIEMSRTLAHYVVGNTFIEHLAYYRLAEPDTIYVSTGERSLRDFFGTSFGFSADAIEETIAGIQHVTRPSVRAIAFAGDENAYFAYTYPLPQLSDHPQAFVLMLIPLQEVAPLLASLVAGESSEVVAFDADGSEIYRTGGIDEALPLADYVRTGETEMPYRTDAGVDYVLQKAVSHSNGWTYISVIRQNDVLSGQANRQFLLILLLLLLMFVANIAVLFCVVVQYRPISNLAATVAGSAPAGDGSATVDERILLSDTIATLKDDSAQKQQFETAYREAEAASNAKSAFLSNMSHDIRTPMNAVIGMTALALRHADEPDYVRDCLKKAQISSRYLLDIINNVLDMSRIESGRVSLSVKRIDLSVFIGELTALLEPSMAARNQRLRVSVDPLACRQVLGDNVRLTQIFVNILSNAVKFTPEGGTITLRLRQEPPSGAYVFTVSDTGIGMEPAFVSRVFDTFSRADNSNTTKVEGTGLGMAIAKNLVELMGGAIKCDSILGEGTTFTVTLPLPRADEEHGEPSPSYSRPAGGVDSAVVDLTGRRILLVEDNAINREIAHEILRETKADVVEAVNGREAVDAYLAHEAGYFDLLLMDLQMPVMDGYAAAAAIRAAQRSDAHTVPIYAMTANTFDEDVRQVREAGMNGHIGKPYTPEVLYRILGQALTK